MQIQVPTPRWHATHKDCTNHTPALHRALAWHHGSLSPHTLATGCADQSMALWQFNAGKPSKRGAPRGTSMAGHTPAYRSTQQWSKWKVRPAPMPAHRVLSHTETPCPHTRTRTESTTVCV